jgi:hypothetical protein
MIAHVRWKSLGHGSSLFYSMPNDILVIFVKGDDYPFLITRGMLGSAQFTELLKALNTRSWKHGR